MNANVCIADNDQVPSISNRTFWHWEWERDRDRGRERNRDRERDWGRP